MAQFSAPTLQKIQDVTVASIAFGLKDRHIIISNLCLLSFILLYQYSWNGKQISLPCWLGKTCIYIEPAPKPKY